MKNRLLSLGIVLSMTGMAQKKAIETYLQDSNVEELAKQEPGKRDRNGILNLLPHRGKSGSFVQYVESSGLGFLTVLDSLESLRMNKLVGNTAGGSGTTSLVSRVAVPAVLGFGVEHGSIQQQNNGTVSTLRGNLLGLAKMAFGSEQFPYCPEIQQEKCLASARWLRRFSASISFENIRARTATVPATPANAAPVTTDLFGNDFRMASWGARFDLTGRNNLDDPKYVTEWTKAIGQLRTNAASETLSKAVIEVFNKSVQTEMYTTWMQETVSQLQNAPAPEFKKRLEERLNLLIQKMSKADPDFGTNIKALIRAYSNYFAVRDELLRELHRHKVSLEYTNQHPQNQLYTSNARLIYSHQPTQSPTLVTLNAGFTFYHCLPAGTKSGRLRDVQLAGQLDRRLGEVPRFGQAVATLAGYYQWMKEDALIRIGTGNVAPGSGVVLPNTAATLLGTRGHIGIVQAKVSIPMSNLVKIPFSVTWANRTELIKERDVRGQVGVTLDVDSLFH